MNKKNLLILLIAVIILGGIIGEVYHQNEVMKEQTSSFKNDTKKFAELGIKLRSAMQFIVNDYSTNWNASIMHNKCIDKNANIVPCSDFNKAMTMRVSFYEEIGAQKNIAERFNSLNTILNRMKENVPHKYMSYLKMCSGYEDNLGELKAYLGRPNIPLEQFNQETSNLIIQLKTKESYIQNDIVVPEHAYSKYNDLEDELHGISLIQGEDSVKKSKVIKATKKDIRFGNLRLQLRVLKNL